MSFLVFLLLAFMAIVAFNVLRFGFGVWRQVKNIHNTFTGQGQRNFHNDEEEQPKHREKVFQKNDGEYVDFEEIPNNSSTAQNKATESANEQKTSKHTTEPQRAPESRISDAEFEEID